MKRYRRRPLVKGLLRIYYGKLPGDNPDIIYSGGEGTSKCDRALLHHVIGSERMQLDLDRPGHYKFGKSLLQELEERGYDITNIRIFD